jgi:hypothetical protein
MDEDIVAAQGWSAEDLEANRRGALSPAQADVLRRRLRAYVRTLLLWLGAMPLVLVAIAIPLALAHRSGGFFVAPVIFLVVEAPVLLWLRARGAAVSADLDAGAVAVVAGPVAGIFSGPYSRQGYARIGAVRMKSFGARADDAWSRPLAFLSSWRATRRPARAYYLPRSALLVAAEPADAGPTPTSERTAAPTP